MGIPGMLFRAVTWWNGQTWGTALYSWRKGVKVGEDDQGNQYFETRDGRRRWVLYNGEIDASRIAPDWHAWLHHTSRESPSTAPLVRKTWEKPHQANPTGTALAHAPAGSIRSGEPALRRDYEAWQPE